jgi:hypothetical protein
MTLRLYLPGVVPSEGRTDAIYAEGVEAGTDGVMTLVQRYRPRGALRRSETIGNPALLPPGSGELTEDGG